MKTTSFIALLLFLSSCVDIPSRGRETICSGLECTGADALTDSKKIHTPIYSAKVESRITVEENRIIFLDDVTDKEQGCGFAIKANSLRSFKVKKEELVFDDDNGSKLKRTTARNEDEDLLLGTWNRVTVKKGMTRILTITLSDPDALNGKPTYAILEEDCKK